MWQYEKKLQYPVNIKNPNPALAKVIVSQLGGPDGELGAALRYLNHDIRLLAVRCRRCCQISAQRSFRTWR